MFGLQGNFVFIKDVYFFHVYMCGHVHTHAGALGSQKKVLDPLELELQVVSCPTWVLGPNPGPCVSGKCS